MEGTEIVPVQQDGGNENPLRRSMRMDDTGRIVSKNCKVCNSAFRNEAEEMHEKGNNVPQIKQFLDSKGEAIPPYTIRYHFNEHYKNLIKQLALQDYCRDLDEMSKRRQHMIEDATSMININWIEMSKLLTIQCDGDVGKERDRQKMIQDAMKTNLECMTFLKSLEDGDAKVRALEEQLARTFAIQIENAKSDDEKKMIVGIMQQFKATSVLVKAK